MSEETLGEVVGKRGGGGPLLFTARVSRSFLVLGAGTFQRGNRGGGGVKFVFQPSKERARGVFEGWRRLREKQSSKRFASRGAAGLCAPASRKEGERERRTRSG